MSALLWYFITVLAIDAIQVSGSRKFPNEAPVGDSELTQAFRSIFQKALEPKGTYHRYLLISTGIVPQPADYSIPRDERTGQPTEMPLTSELLEHFKKHTSEILASREKLSLVIDRLFGDRTAWSSQENRSFSKKRPALPRFTEDFKMKTEDLEGQTTSDFSCSNKFASECSGGTNSVTVDPDIDSTVGISSTVGPESEHISLTESVSESGSGTTFDYLKFLTDRLATSSSFEDESKRMDTNSADQITQSIPPITQDYISFLRSESPQYTTESPSTEAAEFEIEEQSNPDFEDGAVEIETDLSETSQFVPIVSTDYIKFLQNEYPLHISTESSSSEATDISEPIEELHIIDDGNDIESEPTYFNPENELTTTAYSPYTGEFLVTTVELDEEPSFSTAEVLEYLIDNSPATDTTESETLTESSDSLTKKPKSSTRKGRNNIILGDTGGPLGQIFPNLQDIPDTNFTCDDKKHVPGFYADNETSCQVFHVCWPGRRESFLCPWGTTFNQAILACDYWDNSVCAETVAHYDVNAVFKESLSGATEPMEENLLNSYQGNEKVKPKIINQDEYITELLEADVHFAETILNHNLTTIWKKNLLPVKAKLYEEPHPDFSKYLFKYQSKSKRSKDDADDTSSDIDDSESEESASKKLKIESIILNVLRKLSDKSDKI